MKYEKIIGENDQKYEEDIASQKNKYEEDIASQKNKYEEELETQKNLFEDEIHTETKKSTAIIKMLKDQLENLRNEMETQIPKLKRENHSLREQVSTL